MKFWKVYIFLKIDTIITTRTQSSLIDPRPYENKDYEGFCNSEKDLKNFKAIQTSHSLEYFEDSHDYQTDLRRSKSHEDNRKVSKEALIHDEVLQWWELYRDKEKNTKWEERLQRLAERLKKPGGEEKLRLKIEKYLRKVPSYFSDCDEDSNGFRETLPNIIIKKLKKYYLGNDKGYQSNFEVLRVKLPKNENSRNANYYRVIIKRWLKDLNINRTVAKDDIVDFIVHKIEPLILSKPDFDVEFRYILKSNLIDILNEIPISIDSKDKKDFLNRITDDLIEDLLKNDMIINSKKRVKNVGVTCKGDIQSFRPMEKDINEFIIDHLTHFLQISQVYISPQKKLYLERKLINSFMNAINSLTLDINKEYIILVLQCVGELSEHQAKYFTNKLIDDLNDSFWKIRKKHCNEDELPKFLTNSSYSKSTLIFNKTNKEPNELRKIKMSYNNINVSHHSKKLEDEVEKWLKRKQIFLFEDAEFKRTVIKDLVENISRDNTLVQSSWESVEYEVLKWFRKLVGDNIVQHINIKGLMVKLMCIIESARKPLPGQSVVCQNVEVIPGPSTYQDLSYVEELIHIILEWYHELPYDLVGSLDASLKNNLIKELAERIYKRILSKENPNDVIENEVDTWYKNFLQTKPGVHLDKTLINKIKNVTFRKKLIDKEMLNKDILKKYEDSIGDWLDKLKKDPAREDIFVKSKYILVKELAARIYEIKKTQGQLSNAEVIKKMRREVSEWLIKVPIHPQNNISRNRDIRAKMLTDIIGEYNLPLENKETTVSTVEDSLGECDVIDWLKAQSFYIKNNINDKIKQERYITELANEIKNGRSLNIDKLVKYVKKLDVKQEYDDDFIQETVANLRTFLKNVVNETSEADDNLIEIVKQWLRSLPLNITSEREQNVVECFMKELLDILKNSKDNHSNGTGQLLEAIKKIIKVLPIECKTKCDEKFLDYYSKSLLQHLNRITNIGFKIDENIQTENKELKSRDTEDLNLNNYMSQLTEQIEEWLTHLQLPEFKEKGLRAVVINELAKDIIDREKYLEINPSSRGTNIEEIDHLKFQIFKWINKLVGEENLKTVEHAPALMQRIQSMRDPHRKTVGNIGVNTRQSIGAGPSTYRISRPTNFEVSQMPILGVPGLGGSMTEDHGKRPDNKRFSNPLGYPLDYIPKIYVNNRVDAAGHAKLPNMNQQSNSNDPSFHIPSSLLQPETATPYKSEIPEVAEGTTAAQIHQEYDEVFRQRSNEIPLEVSTPEEQTVVNYIRQGIINIIWNTYFKLKSNPEIENDYRYFEILMENALDEIFDDLPATAAIQSIKHKWKINVVQDVITMLKKVHSITDSPRFKFLLDKHKFYRLIAKKDQQRIAIGLQGFFVKTTADDFLREKNYNEEDPIKANIYKLRLMKYIEHVVRGIDFYNNVQPDFTRMLKAKLLYILNNVPVPGTILPGEVNEVEIGYVIENWFNELPGIIMPTDGLEHVWIRLQQLLARKINELEMRIYADDYELDRLIMHEATLFLKTPEMLCGDNVLRIDEMVEDLANRLRQRRQDQLMPQYTSFEQNRPLCSSIIQPNPNAIQIPTHSAPIEQCTANQPLIGENVVQPSRMSQAGLINLPNPISQVMSNNVEQIVQPEVQALIHDQIEENIVNNIPQLIQQEFIVNGTQSNRITTAVAGFKSQAGDLGSPRQVLETSNLVNILNPVRGIENQNLHYSHQLARGQIVSEPPTTEIPVNQIQGQIPQTQLSAGQAARSSQELLPNSRPTSTHRTRSTVRVGDVGKDIIEKRVCKRVRCTCAGSCRSSRQKYVCSCDDDDDDDEDVLFVPCRYYF